jgi:hypothetical protein
MSCVRSALLHRLVALQHQVDPAVADVDLGHADPVVVGVDGGGERLLSSPASASRSRSGISRTSGAPSSSPGMGRNWCPSDRGSSRAPCPPPARDGEDFLQLVARDVELDGAPAAHAAAERARAAS